MRIQGSGIWNRKGEKGEKGGKGGKGGKNEGRSGTGGKVGKQGGKMGKLFSPPLFPPVSPSRVSPTASESESERDKPHTPMIPCKQGSADIILDNCSPLEIRLGC